MIPSRASVASQIATVQKDEVYLNHLRGLANTAFQHMFGIQSSIRWNKELHLFADMAYFSLTTLSSLQTLGEEYTGLVQVNSSMKQIPSIHKRILMVLLYSSFPIVVDKILAYVESSLPLTPSSALSGFGQNVIQKCRVLVISIYRLNLSLFYLRGIFHSLSKRIAKVHYVSILGKQVTDASHISEFNALGWLSLWQSLIALAVQLYSIYKDYERYKSSNLKDNSSLKTNDEVVFDNEDLPSLKCSLCWDKRVGSTTTPCGHLFCWNCIHSWINTKPECPICREKILPQQLVFLKNFN